MASKRKPSPRKSQPKKVVPLKAAVVQELLPTIRKAETLLQFCRRRLRELLDG